MFRNYKPSSEALADGVVEPAQPSDVETLVEEQLIDAKQHASEMQQVCLLLLNHYFNIQWSSIVEILFYFCTAFFCLLE